MGKPKVKKHHKQTPPRHVFFFRFTQPDDYNESTFFNTVQPYTEANPSNSNNRHKPGKEPQA